MNALEWVSDNVWMHVARQTGGRYQEEFNNWFERQTDWSLLKSEVDTLAEKFLKTLDRKVMLTIGKNTAGFYFENEVQELWGGYDSLIELVQSTAFEEYLSAHGVESR